MWRLTTQWYGDRLDPAFQPKPVEQLQRFLTNVGLVSEFWQLVEPSIGNRGVGR